VEVRDQYDNVVTTDGSNVTIALATGTGTLSGTKTVAAVSGVATFTGLSEKFETYNDHLYSGSSPRIFLHTFFCS